MMTVWAFFFPSFRFGECLTNQGYGLLRRHLFRFTAAWQEISFRSICCPPHGSRLIDETAEITYTVEAESKDISALKAKLDQAGFSWLWSGR